MLSESGFSGPAVPRNADLRVGFVSGRIRYTAITSSLRVDGQGSVATLAVARQSYTMFSTNRDIVTFSTKALVKLHNRLWLAMGLEISLLFWGI